MRGSRYSLSFLLLILNGFAMVQGVANAQSMYYTSTNTDQNCVHCHTASPVTCNGCHRHGALGSLATDTTNLAATTDKTSYTTGEDIYVTLTGGNIPKGGGEGWVRVNVYAGNGTLLVSNSAECPHNAASYPATCDLPVTLKTRAVAGMTNLYVAWMGAGNEVASPAAGPVVTPGVTAGKRATTTPGHIEEVVLTNTFRVTESMPAPAVSRSGASLLIQNRPPICKTSCPRIPDIEPPDQLCVLSSSSCVNGVTVCHYTCTDVEIRR